MRDSLALLCRVTYAQFVEDSAAEHDRLFSAATLAEPSTTIEEWKDTWTNAFERRSTLNVSPADLINSGRLLARIAETYTLREIVDDLFGRIELLISEGDPDELQMAEVLIEAGELDRRLGRLESAVDRFNRALAIAERPDTAASHKLLSRVFYEFAYIDLYAGDAEAATRQLALSEAEANEAGDLVGAGIARALTAAVLIEEGVLSDAFRLLQAETANFARLATAPEIIRANRHVFAGRWRMNCEMHEIQTLLASGEVAAARQATDRIASNPNPSIVARSSLDFIDASIALSEGNLNRAAERTSACRSATLEPKNRQEAYATICALYGVIELVRGNREGARSSFQEAVDLDAALRNARGQGWAALGLASLFMEDGDTRAAISVLEVGIDRCARCCAPVRRALVELRTVLEGSAASTRDWTAVLRGLAGPIPTWLLTDNSSLQ